MKKWRANKEIKKMITDFLYTEVTVTSSSVLPISKLRSFILQSYSNLSFDVRIFCPFRAKQKLYRATIAL